MATIRALALVLIFAGAAFGAQRKEQPIPKPAKSLPSQKPWQPRPVPVTLAKSKPAPLVKRISPTIAVDTCDPGRDAIAAILGKSKMTLKIPRHPYIRQILNP